LLAFGCAARVFIWSILGAFIGLTTTQTFYKKMLHGTFQASMSFFDITPIGWILSCVSSLVTNWWKDIIVNWTLIGDLRHL
jgi:hypothetical protein